MASNTEQLNCVEILTRESNRNNFETSIKKLIEDYDLNLSSTSLTRIFIKIRISGRDIDFIVRKSFNKDINLFKAIILYIDKREDNIYKLRNLLSLEELHTITLKILRMNYYENPYNSIWLDLYHFHEYDILKYCTRLYQKRVIGDYVNEIKSGKLIKSAIKSQV